MRLVIEELDWLLMCRENEGDGDREFAKQLRKAIEILKEAEWPMPKNKEADK